MKTRAAVILCGRSSGAEITERFVHRLTGALLLLMGWVLAAVNFLSLSRNIAAKHGTIIMITIATYTFGKLAGVIAKSLRQRGQAALLLKTTRNISCAEAAASIWTMQRSMLVSFGPMDQGLQGCSTH